MILEAFAAPTVQLVDLFESWAVIRISAPPLWHDSGSKGNGLRPSRYEIALVCLTLDPRTSAPVASDRSILVGFEGAMVEVVLDDLVPHAVYDIRVRGVTTSVDGLQSNRPQNEEDQSRRRARPTPWLGAWARIHVPLLPRLSVAQGVIEESSLNLRWSFCGWVAPPGLADHRPAVCGAHSTKCLSDLVSLFEVEICRSSTFDRSPQIERFSTTLVPGVSPLGGSRRIPLAQKKQGGCSSSSGEIYFVRVRAYRPSGAGSGNPREGSSFIVGSHLPSNHLAQHAWSESNVRAEAAVMPKGRETCLFGAWSEYKRLVCLPDISVVVDEIGANSCTVSWQLSTDECTTASSDRVEGTLTDCAVHCWRATPIAAVGRENVETPFVHETRHVRVMDGHSASAHPKSNHRRTTTTTTFTMLMSSLAPSTVYNLQFSYRFVAGGEVGAKHFRFQTRPAPLIDLHQTCVGSTFANVALTRTGCPNQHDDDDLLGGFANELPQNVVVATGGGGAQSGTTSRCMANGVVPVWGDSVISDVPPRERRGGAHLLSPLYEVQALVRGAVISSAFVLHVPMSAKVEVDVLAREAFRLFCIEWWVEHAHLRRSPADHQILVEALLQPPPPPHLLRAVLDPLPDGTPMILRARCGFMSVSALLDAVADVRRGVVESQVPPATTLFAIEEELISSLSARCVFSAWSDAPLPDRPAAEMSTPPCRDESLLPRGKRFALPPSVVSSSCTVSTLSDVKATVEQRMPTILTIAFAHTTATTRRLRIQHSTEEEGGAEAGMPCEVPVEWLFVCLMKSDAHDERKHEATSGSTTCSRCFRREWNFQSDSAEEGTAPDPSGVVTFNDGQSIEMSILVTSSSGGALGGGQAHGGLASRCAGLDTKRAIEILDESNPLEYCDRRITVFRIPLHDVRMLRWDGLCADAAYTVVWNALDAAGVWLGGKHIQVRTLPTPEVSLVSSLKKVDWGPRMELYPAGTVNDADHLFNGATYAPILDKDFFLYARNQNASIRDREDVGSVVNNSPVVDPTISEAEGEQLLRHSATTATNVVTAAAELSTLTVQELLHQRRRVAIAALQLTVDSVTTSEVVLHWVPPCPSPSGFDEDNGASASAQTALPLEYRLRVFWSPLPHLAVALGRNEGRNFRGSSGESCGFRDYMFRCESRCSLVRLSALSPHVLHKATLSVFDKQLNRWTPWSDPSSATFSVTSRLEVRVGSISPSGFSVCWSKRHTSVDPRVLHNPVMPEWYEVSVERCSWEDAMVAVVVATTAEDEVASPPLHDCAQEMDVGGEEGQKSHMSALVHSSFAKVHHSCPPSQDASVWPMSAEGLSHRVMSVLRNSSTLWCGASTVGASA